MLKSCIKAICDEFLTAVKGKMIIVVILIIPLIANILIGFVLYNGQIKNIPMAVIDQDNSSLSRTIVQYFRENETFSIKYTINSSEEMKELLDESKVRVGMIIPEGFSKDVTMLKSPTILMLYDGSHISIASSAKTKATEILMTVKTGALIKLLQGKLNLTPDEARKMALDIQVSTRTLYNPTKSFKNFLMPGFGTAAVQSGIVLMGAVSIREIDRRRKRIKRVGSIVGKVIFYGLLGTISLMVCIYIQTGFFGVPMRGSLQDTLFLSAAFSFAVSAFSIAVSSWISREMVATIINAVIFVPNTILVGYTWPVMSMPKPYQIVSVFFPFFHYADNIRDICLKGSTAAPVIQDIEWLLRFTFFAVILGAIGIMRFKAEEKEEEEKNRFAYIPENAVKEGE